ncbi:MAG: hypothetical protein ABJE95_04840 [Byssovorax sp.]
MKRALPLLFAALAACSSGAPSEATGPSLTETPETPAPPVDHPPIDPAKKPVTSAVAQRISVAQLRGVFPVVLGTDVNGKDITWMSGSAPALDKMADVLGEADYAFVTQDNRDPSALYLKFMDDAARDVCGRALTADAARPKATDRVLLRHVEPADTATTNAAGLDQNLAYLLLRFHGIKVKDGDTARTAPLAKLFTDSVTAAAAGKPATATEVTEGWRAVCVALITAPEFHLY